MGGRERAAKLRDARSLAPARATAAQKRYGYLIENVGLLKRGNLALRTARAMHEPTAPVMPTTFALVTRPFAPDTVTWASAVP
jgi:hypothetical protein